MIQMHFATAVAIGTAFWHARHVEMPCTPTPVMATVEQMPVDEWGRPAAFAAIPSQCKILVGPEGQMWRYLAPVWYCAAITHELGHIGGLLSHTPTGVMAGPRDPNWIPWDCRVYVRRNHIE